MSYQLMGIILGVALLVYFAVEFGWGGGDPRQGRGSTDPGNWGV